MELFVIILSYTLAITFGLVPLIKKKQPRDIIVFSFLIILSAAMLIFKMFISPDSKAISDIIADFIEKFAHTK